LSGRGRRGEGHLRGRRGDRPRTSVAVIVGTYEWHHALDAVLRALADQSDTDFDVVVADDGSGNPTAGVVEHWRSHFGGRLSHVWQPDTGFRLARVLNLGVLATNAQYLVIIHGESIPRRHFVRALRSCARPGWFVAGRRVELSRELTSRVLTEKLPVQHWSRTRWLHLRRQAPPFVAFTSRDRRRVGQSGLPEYEPPGRGYGYLLGVSRADFVQVDGYDMRYEGWGEEDVDIALRLRRLGLRCGHAGPDATLIHLWHPSAEVPDRGNWRLLQETEKSDRIEAVEGLSALAREVGRAQLRANRVTSSSSSSAPAKS
jgi:hypothetical protein